MKKWTPLEVSKLFRLEKTKTSLLRDEAAGKIPKAKKIPRGKSYTRMWAFEDLPQIGELYGFLNKPKDKKVISIYTPKGGVLKSTIALNLGRILALNNIKTLIIGLDIQCTITRNLSLEELEAGSLNERIVVKGLYDASKDNKEGGCNIKDTIKPTNIPTLFYIPETADLNLLENKIRNATKREHYLDKLIRPLKKNFDVILFDNSPSWSFLIQNSLVVATDIISPIACDFETFKSLAGNIEMINDFKSAMEIDWNSFTLVPTKLERTNISTQIEAQYRTQFPDIITTSSIRHTVAGQESSLYKLSTMEFDSKSPLASDYYEVICGLWNRINSAGKENDCIKN